MPVAFRVGFSINHGHIGNGAVGYPHFGAVQDIFIALFFSHGGHGRHIGARIRLGKPHASDPFAGDQSGKIFSALRLGTVLEKCICT